jgi:LacI family transcriptional regulator
VNGSAKRITLAQVAQRARVSVPTASKVLSGRTDVADRTRLRVQKAVRDLGYRSPHERGRGGAGPAPLDLVIAGLESEYAVEVMRGIIDGATTEQAEIVISSMTPDMSDANVEEWAGRLRQGGRRRLVLVTGDMSTEQLAVFRRGGISVVLVDPRSKPHDGVPTVCSTDWAGGRAATAHLLELGHRRVGYIGGAYEVECNRARQSGYLAALVELGVEFDRDLVVTGRFDPATGAGGIRRLLALPDPPTAVFCGNDAIATGVIRQADALGIDVPADLSVVGFDGTPMVENTIPRLTSVAQPLRQIGRTALRTVLQLDRGEPIAAQHVELATNLVVRDSTAPPRGR